MKSIKILNKLGRRFKAMILSLLFISGAYAKQIPTVTGIIKTIPFSSTVTIGMPTASNTIFVTPLPSTTAQDYNIQNTISLKYDLNTSEFFANNTDVIVKVTVNRWDASNNLMPVRVEKLKVSINNKIALPILEKSVLKLNNAYKVAVTVDSIWVNNVPVNDLPAYVSVESEINLDRYYNYTLPANTIVNMNSITELDSDCDGIKDEIQVNWTNPIFAQEEYQLEWTFVNSYAATSGNYAQSFFTADFKNNSTRITTFDNNYKITLAFDKGYIAFRVRAVGRDYTNPSIYIYGPWSAPDLINMGSLSTSEVFTVTTEHEKLKNWQYATTYAEEGKKKEVINYFDGSLHNRQTVTKINSDKNVIVGETMYDFQGRPAVNVLPVPVVFNCTLTTAEPAIKYYNKFNVDDSGKVYSKNDFDIDISSCISSANPMDTVSGASRYYSNNNPDKSKNQAYLPHAKEFPFTQVEYTPDNTGRIRNQSGVGKDYQLGTGKETKYLYGQPNQIQVDRLFASETGDASHYKKNVVIDANGQSSVTYLNQEGKTIATALAGIPPNEGTSSNTRLDSLEYANANQKKFTIDLFNKNALGQSILNTVPPSNDRIDFSTQLLVAYKSLYEFKYLLSVDTVHDACLRPGICFNCIYDLELSVKDECGLDLIPSASPYKKMTGKFATSGPNVVFTTTCSSGPSLFKDSVMFNLVLNPGVYTIAKSLKINQDAKDFYINAYLDSVNNSCFKTLSDFQAEALAQIDTSDCYNTCASCVADLGSKDDFVAGGKGTPEQWEFLVEKCNEPCKQKTLCQVTYEMMLSDVSPGGQYGKFNNITYSAASEPLSVFNTGNVLNPNIIPGQDADWQHPRMRINGSVYTMYLDEDGVRTKVNVTPNGLNYLPLVVNTASVYTDPTTLLKYTYPENLANLSDFIPLWDPNYAKSLVMYHPEYAYYLSCSEQEVKFPGDNRSSDKLDSLMLVTETFAQAVANGFIKTNWNLPGPPPLNKIKDIWQTASGTLYDPFFTNSNFQYTNIANSITGSKTTINMAGSAPFNVNLQSEMSNIITNYKNIGSTFYTMADVAAILARCGNNFAATPTATCMAFGMDYYPYTTPLNDSVRNKEWRFFRQFYLTEKMKLQWKRMNFYAKYSNDTYSNFIGGCNSCIGNSGYNPYSAGMIYLTPFTGLPFSAYYDFSQPCSYATKSNYGSVTKRFYDPANTSLNTNVSSTIYQMTGQCPMAFHMQNFLNGMTSSSKLVTSTLSLNTVNEFNPDMYLAVSGGVNPPMFVNYTWSVTSTSGSVFTANIVDPSTNLVKCTFTLDITGTLIPNFSNIIGITQLSHNSSLPGPASFTAVATYTNGSTTLSANIKGSTSCIDIKNCSFPPNCVPNQFASDMQNLLSYLQSNGVLNSPTPQSLSTSTTTSIFLTPSILNTLGTPNNSVVYQFIAPNKLTLTNAGNTNTIVLTVTGVVPAGSLSMVTSFSNIRSNYNNLFKIDGMNSSNVKVSDIDGKAEKITPTQTIGISMGDCGLPTSPECSTQEHKVAKDLEKLVNEILTTKPFNSNVNVYSLASLSSLLQSYLNPAIVASSSTYSASTSATPNYDSLNISIAFADEVSCELKLFHYRNNGTIANFPNIVSVTNLTGIGTPDIAGNYYNFYAIATYTNSFGFEQKDTIYGKSCWPIKNCIECPPDSLILSEQARRDSAYVASGQASYDPNIKAYAVYKTSVDSLNIKMGWSTSSTDYITPVDLLTYTDKGYINADEYVKYVNNFDSVVDSKALLLPDNFIYEYGNLVNCNKEYNRYVTSIAKYNVRASSIPGTTILPAIPDSTFYSNHLCDSVYLYVKYLSKYPAAGPTPLDILQYFNLTTTPNYTDSCKKLYEQYIKIHSSFLNNPVVQAKCKEANINHPLYSYDEIVKYNLCCTSQGITTFANYINSLATASVNCPPSLPMIDNCNSTSPAVVQSDELCQKYYTIFKTKLNQYNASAYATAQSHTLSTTIYPTFNLFKKAGYCDCILNYINYLNNYITAPVSTTLSPIVPVDIDNYGGCLHSVPSKDSCQIKFEAYNAAVNNYNNYATNNPSLGLPLITVKFDLGIFVKRYCLCADKFIAGLNAIINGMTPTKEQLASMIDLPSNCDKPCTNGPQDSAFYFPPYVKYDNPCVQQQINLALQNAANAYQQYIDSLTTYFADKYIRHCLKALEDYNYKYVDKEYHFTLYYYDQAGNLIKTVPPEGVEPVNITSYTDPVATKINSDRTFNQQNVFTAHRMATKYIYNSLNQLIYQSLPDHDNMDICDGVNPNGLDTGLVINSVQFVTPNKGYLCGYVRYGANFKRGFIYTSNDGGNYWVKLNGVTAANLQKVQFTTVNIGYAVSDNGLVFKTNDGGNSWDLLTGLYNPTTGTRNVGLLNDLFFTNSIGLVGGVKSGPTSLIYYTTDGGVTFSEAAVTGQSNNDTITGFAFDGTNYIASARNGNNGKLFTSTNGTNWTPVVNFSANTLRKVQFISNSLAFAVGEEGTLLKLAQNISGTNPPQWEIVPTRILQNINDVYFKNANEGVALIDSIPGSARIWKTTDGGINWQPLSAPGKYYQSLQLYDASQDKLVAAGKNGLLTRVLLNTTPFGVINISSPNTNNYSYSDAILHNPSSSLRTLIVSDASPEVHFTYNGLAGSPVWVTNNTTTLSPPVPAADASYKKVLMMDSVNANPYIKAVMLTANGKLYSYYLANGSTTPICRPVNVVGGFAGKFFSDITSNGQTFTTPIYAFDSINKNLYVINFAGTVANAVQKTLSPTITRAIKSIDIHNTSDKFLMVGVNGHIQYSSDVSLATVNLTNNSFSVVPLAINKIRRVNSSDFIAVGIDGSVWKNYGNVNDWYLRNSGTVETFNSIAVDNLGKGLIAANNGKSYLVTNAQTQNPTIALLTTPVSTDLTDVAIESSGTQAYLTSKNGKVIYCSNYNSPSYVLASSPSMSSVNGVAFKAGPNACVVGNNVFAANYFSTYAMITKNLYTRDLISTHFYDSNNGYAIDSMHVIRRTSDGGVTWSVVIPDNTNKILSKVFATSAGQGIVVGKNRYAGVVNSGVLSTISIPATVPTGTDFNDINFNNSGYGVIAGSATRAMQIVSSGPTTYAVTYIGQAMSPPKVPNFNAVHVFNDNSFITAGTRGVIFYNKSGVFYNQTNYTPAASVAMNTVILKDIFFHDNYSGYVVGEGGNAFKVVLNDVIANIGTTANSLAWQPFCSQALYMNYTSNAQILNLKFNAIAFSSRTNGMIVGSDANVSIAGNYPIRYARLIRDESGYYSTRFWYDKLGRLVISQNTKQFKKSNPANNLVKQAFSYTLYDALGRIVEVGEKYENHLATTTKFNTVFGSMVNNYFNNNAIDDVKLLAWINGPGARHEVTKTYYDAQTILPISYTQNNLRKRVASTTFEDVFDGNDLTYQHATHYTYDIHGNVSTLWQENKLVAITGQQFKQIDYKFDLISGKVNKVIYSPGQADQFIHKYTYDADNRITKVETSKDDVVYDLDAKYFYYAHGPLARVEYGKDHVQGIDYAYTLQGWIKGVNSNVLKKGKDMGSDGDLTFTNPNGNFARDVVGYTLNYYKGDYEAIDFVKWNNANSRFEAYTNNSDLFNARNDLFNGNISAMVTSISKPDSTAAGVTLHPQALPMGYAYRYDQLNRIKRSTAASNLDTVANTWLNNGSTIAGLYRNTFTYDANGNIQTQVKRDSLGNILDSLVYKYEEITAGKKRRNRLYHVDDLVNTPSIPGDIEDQGTYNATNPNTTNNYGFDEIGNLIRDNSEDIANIEWMVTGKIKSITRTPSSLKENLSFDYDAQGNRIAKHVYTSSNVWKRSTYYIRDAQGNVMSVYEKKASSSLMSYMLAEQHLYGSSRIGMRNPNLEMIGAIANADTAKMYLGIKNYELSNHLGNVLTVISDKKIQMDVNNDNVTDYYVADILSATDYYPFGSVTPGRSFTSESYRYGYQSSEKDDEISGSGNSYSTYFRELDTRLAKWWGIDPKFKPEESPYASMANNPMWFTDILGDDLDVGKNEQSRKDIRSLATGDNQKYIKVDDQTGKVTLDFGEMNKEDVAKVLKKDEGLNLINDLTTSPKKFYYSAAEVETYGSEIGTNTLFFTSKDNNGIINASDNGKDSNGGNAFMPKKGYNGQVVISTQGEWEEKDKTGTLVNKPRSSLVFHELAENFERTNNGCDYNGNKSNGGFGAHYKASKREGEWWGKSNQPGVANYSGNPDNGMSYKDLYNKYKAEIEALQK